MLALTGQGVTLLYGPSICTRSVQMDLLRSQVLQPFPTPGLGTLWVAGESLRDRRVSCLLQWTVRLTCSPSLGLNRSTCRRECSWSGPLVTPPGRCHCGPLTSGHGRIPLYCVCSGGADTVTGGAPSPPRLGPSPAFLVGPFRPAAFFSLCGLWWWDSHLSWVGWVAGGGGAAPRHSWPSCLCACSRHSWLRLAAGGGGWSLATPGCGSWVWLPATPGWGPLLLVGGWAFAVVGGGVGLCDSWLGSADLSGPVPRFRLRVLGGRSLATPGLGPWVRSPATPGCGARWCWWWVAPRHSWLRVPGAVPCHSWLGSADCGGGRLRGVGWEVSRVVCVCGAARALCALCVCGCGVGVGVSAIGVGAYVASGGGVQIWVTWHRQKELDEGRSTPDKPVRHTLELNNAHSIRRVTPENKAHRGTKYAGQLPPEWSQGLPPARPPKRPPPSKKPRGPNPPL